MIMELTDTQKEAVTAWFAAGATLPCVRPGYSRNHTSSLPRRFMLTAMNSFSSTRHGNSTRRSPVMSISGADFALE